ncbi:MAG: AMP-binding protein, partial [Phycisphaeraceae bacterium]|nr:AMP-binding protein [Phycisphaeraceae bacterium]
MKEPKDWPPTLRTGFLRQWQERPETEALNLRGESWSYAELGRRAAAVAHALERVRQDADPPLVGILASRSISAFAGILGTLFAGYGYLPLNPKFPAGRLRRLLEMSGCRTVVIGPEAV